MSDAFAHPRETLFPAVKSILRQTSHAAKPLLEFLPLISLRLPLCSEQSPGENEPEVKYTCTTVQNVDAHEGKLQKEKHEEARSSSLQRASQLATNCLALTSRTFLSTNEAGGRQRSVCVCVRVTPSYSVCVFERRRVKTQSGDLMESGPQLFFIELFAILWKECMDGLHCWLLQ